MYFYCIYIIYLYRLYLHLYGIYLCYLSSLVGLFLTMNSCHHQTLKYSDTIVKICDPAVSYEFNLVQYLFTASVQHQSWPCLTGRGLTPAKVNVCLCSWEPADQQIHWQKLLPYTGNLPVLPCYVPPTITLPVADSESHESGISAQRRT